MKAKEENVIEQKEIELCAVSKEFVIKQINKLVGSNQDVFNEYFAWAQILNSKVSMISQEETNDKYAE